MKRTRDNGKKVIKFVVSSALVTAPLTGCGGQEEHTVNEPAPEHINEPPPVEEPTVNELPPEPEPTVNLPPPPRDVAVNEVAPEDPAQPRPLGEAPQGGGEAGE